VRVKRFSPDQKVKIPGGHPGLYGMLIAMNREIMAATHPDLEAFAQRVHGLPFALDTRVMVEAMYFEPQARLDEHSAPHDILFIVIVGSGSLRLGGPQGETRVLSAGDAVIWPAGIDHLVWTDGEPLSAIVINLFDDTSGKSRADSPSPS
jgi:quercetin dioxygenase-like cupin family protein